MTRSFPPSVLAVASGAHVASRGQLVDLWKLLCACCVRSYQKCAVSFATTTTATTTTTCGGLSPAYVSLVAGRPPLVSLCHVNCRLCVCVCVCSCGTAATTTTTTTTATAATTSCGQLLLLQLQLQLQLQTANTGLRTSANIWGE